MERRQYHFLAGVADRKLLICCYIIVSSTLVFMTSPAKPDCILEQLKDDMKQHKIVTNQHPFQLNGFKSDITKMFDKVIHWLTTTTNEGYRSGSDSTRNIEHFSLHIIEGDGRCMFRALAKGMAINDGVELSRHEEKVKADELKLEIKKVVCDNDDEHSEFEEAIVAITIEESLKSYCKRIMQRSFWGGEAELSILSRLLSLPVIVYQPKRQNMFKVDASAGFIPIATYSPQFKDGSTRGDPKNVVRLSFTRNYPNHYDLLLPRQESSSSA